MSCAADDATVSAGLEQIHMTSRVKVIRSESFELNVAADHEAMSRLAATLIGDELQANPRMLLGVATGSTPTRTYEILACVAAREPERFEEIRLLKADEWGGLAADDPATCEAYLQASLLRPLAVATDRYIGWESDPDDPAGECRRIGDWLRDNGPIDLCVLGLGRNGHLAFNEPSESLTFGPHIAKLSEESLRHPMLGSARSGPRYGLTIGIGDIMRSRKVLLLVSGEQKAAQLRRLMNCGITTLFPASVLALHPRLTILCDAAAARGVGEQVP
jgi:galactosamine-6-phosphate isomerase